MHCHAAYNYLRRIIRHEEHALACRYARGGRGGERFGDGLGRGEGVLPKRLNSATVDAAAGTGASPT